VTPDSGPDDQTREERLEIARRDRERRGAELRALAAPHVAGEVEAAGEFSSVPKEAMAAIPFVGVLLIPWARWRARRLGLPLRGLLALDAERVYMLDLQGGDLRRDVAAAAEFASWPRAEVSAERAGRAFMRDRVDLTVPDRDEPIRLFAPPLIRNPWASEVVRLLGGEAPEPLDLGEPAPQPPA
jgi:hypothetical protein